MLDALAKIIVPKKRAKPGGQSYTNTYNAQNPQQVLSTPQYRDHLTDIFDTRQADDSRALIKFMFQHDSDMSAAVGAYLTMANTPMTILVRDMEGEIDREATKDLLKGLTVLTRQIDYTLGFQLKPDLNEICEELRYMLLMRGAIGAELVLDKQMMPSKIRNVDMASIQWYEKQPGEYKPRQQVPGNQDGIDLDIPTFFVAFYRRDPTTIYTKSPFVAAINTIAARQQVINDLYRIMQRTGYPRMAAEVLEEVVRKNLPADLMANRQGQAEWIGARLAEIRSTLQSLRADETLVHLDSVRPYVMNEKSPSAAIDITSVIDTLNAQNQAALKTMATVIGRGTSGVNTSSVEARIAAMNADQLNQPVAEILSDIFSFILHMNGYQGFAEVSFAKAEMRPEMELEAQKAMRQARLRKDLSEGLITDEEYHLLMYNRLRPDSVPELSGTKFEKPAPDMVDAGGATPNGDPLGRSLTPDGSDMAKSNGVK